MILTFNITNWPPPIKDRVGDFWFLGRGRGGVFFICIGGGRVHIGGLAKIDCDGEGDSIFKNWIVYLLFYCLDLARCVVVQYWLCFHMYCVSKNWTWLNKNVCTEFFLALWVLWLLTLFRIIVALITYVMQVCEFRFTVSFVSFFSFYVYWQYYMWYDTCILFYYSII